MKQCQILIHPKAKKFIERLENKKRAQIDRFFDLFEEYGTALPNKYLKRISKNIWELRPGDIRLFLTIKANKGIVIHGIKKKKQKLTQKDINLAERRIRDVQ